MQALLEGIRNKIRAVMTALARGLDKLTGGKLHPNAITLTGFLLHFPVAYLIYDGELVWAGLLLIFFGLFDALDGALARVQKRSSNFGMFLDSVTDRLKEIIIYVGLGAYFVSTGDSALLVWLIGALGVSIVISYTNAWGEVVISKAKISKQHTTNNAFRSGVMSFDVRIFLLSIGLLFDILPLVIFVIAGLGVVTIAQRIIVVAERLKVDA
jgi:CDP-diacylglycerol--glycerol-3-phosphate 3-phosphatidyltransferase